MYKNAVLRILRSHAALAVLAFLTAAVLLFASFGSVPRAARASTIAFDNTNVLDDLRSSTVNGRPFNILEYPYSANVMTPKIINVVEYCYSMKTEVNANYGVYLYFYNPKALDIDTETVRNTVQLATKYDSSGVPTDWEKYILEFCNKSEEADYKNLFYKFKVKDHKSADGKILLQRVNPTERRYDVTGVEIKTKGAQTATEYGVGGTYRFKGYSKGCGVDVKAESTLVSTVNDLETVKLDVRHTFYRTGVSDKGKNYQNELNSVYFAVPNRLLEEYGRKLQKIKAEWYEYKTAPMVVTSNEGMYNGLMPFVGQDIGITNNSVPYCFGEEVSTISVGVTTTVKCRDTYNMGSRIFGNIHCFSDSTISRLSLLFSTYGASLNDFVLQGDELRQYVYSYDKSYAAGKLPGREISADLFDSAVDEGRTRGYNCAEIDSDDKFNMLSYDSNHSWWDKFLDYGFGGPNTSTSFQDVAPIVEVKASDLIGADNKIAQTLLMNKSEVKDLKTYHAAAALTDKTVFMFRFALNDYYATNLIAFKTDNSAFPQVYNAAFLAKQTVFLDFDILSLTFNKAGVYHVIAAVSSPIDIFNDVTPPPKVPNLLALILAILALIIILIVLAPVLPVIFRGIWWVISLPFKLIGKVIRAMKNAGRKE